MLVFTLTSLGKFYLPHDKVIVLLLGHEIMPWMTSTHDQSYLKACSVRFFNRFEKWTSCRHVNNHLWFLVFGSALLEHVTIGRGFTVIQWVPPIISTTSGGLTMGFALIVRLNKELDIQEIVFAQGALHVVHHSFGTWTKDETEFLLTRSNLIQKRIDDSRQIRVASSRFGSGVILEIRTSAILQNWITITMNPMGCLKDRACTRRNY